MSGISKANELTPVQVEEKDYLDMLLTNALSPMRVIELFHDQVATNGVIAVMSSELGSIKADHAWATPFATAHVATQPSESQRGP